MAAQIIQAHEVTGKETGSRLAVDQVSGAKKIGGYTAVIGAVLMVIGAALWGTSGTDLWAALDSGDMAGYLTATGAVKAQLVANLSIWISGVLVLGVAGTMFAEISQRRRLLAQVGLYCFRTAVSVVMVAYIAMLAVVVQLGGDASPAAVSIAEVVGWIGARTDDLATALIIGAGPLFFSLAGRGEWVPTGLLRWSYLAALTGILSLLGLYIPALYSLIFLIVPVGVIWMIVAGVVLLRQAK